MGGALGIFQGCVWVSDKGTQSPSVCQGQRAEAHLCPQVLSALVPEQSMGSKLEATHDHVTWVLLVSPAWSQAGWPGDCGSRCPCDWHTASAQD